MGYLLGVDGGGSKTDCLLADETGRVLGFGRGGPVNTNYVPRQEALEALVGAIQAALAQAGFQGREIDALCLSAPAEPGVVAETLRECRIQRFIRTPEGETPRWAARFWIDDWIGVTVDAGTGSLARGWAPDGREANAGAWGTTLGDEGSGYWIAIQAMRAVLHAYDGRIPKTMLTRAVLEFYGMVDELDMVFQATQGLVKSEESSLVGISLEPVEATVWKDAGDGLLRFSERRHRTLTRDQIASLCPVVAQAASQGDWKAIEIFQQAGVELARLCVAVITRLEMNAEEFAVLPFGGVFRAGKLVLPSFEETLHAAAPNARVTEAPFQPVVGAVLYGLNALHGAISPAILQAVEQSAALFPACIAAGVRR